MKQLSHHFTCLPAASTPSVEFDRQNDVLVFTHIPKTAGTNLGHLFSAMHLLLGFVRTRFMGEIYDRFHRNAMQALQTTPVDRYRNSNLVEGHFPHGSFSSDCRKIHYVTLLREPVSRYLSHYKHLGRKYGMPQNVPVKDLLHQGVLTDNLQVRQLAGCTDAGRPCDARMLQRAIRNLDSVYRLAGITEQFDLFLSDLQVFLGLPDLLTGRFQQSVSGPQSEADRQTDAIREITQFDQELYAHVADRLSSRKPLQQPSGSLQEKLASESDLLCFLPVKDWTGEHYRLVEHEAKSDYLKEFEQRFGRISLKMPSGSGAPEA